MPRISTPSGFGGGSPFGFGEGGGAKGKTSSPRKRYTPDLTAGVFQIIRRGKAPAENLGFGVEAIYVENMPKSRRSNIKMPRVKPFKMPNLLGGRRK